MKRASCIAVAAIILSAAAAVSADGPFTVVTSGLENPRGLTFGPGGRLYVAQAGVGGPTGRISEIRDLRSGERLDVVTGLISTQFEGSIVGISGLSALGNGTLYGIMARSNAAEGSTSELGHLLQVNPSGHVNDVANVGDFEYDWTTQHQSLAPHDFPDANPYGVLAAPGGAYVVDAGANTLSFVGNNGEQHNLAYFPNNRIADATPTCVAKGPDGALYVGTLALVDSLVFGPSATVYRVDPNTVVPDDLATVISIATPWATGLWPINGCAFGPDGSFYASELITSQNFTGGDVVKIPFDNPTVQQSLTGQTMMFGGGVAVDKDGTVYAVNGAIGTNGAVIRLSEQ